MNPTHAEKISKELSITQKQVEMVAALLSEGSTIPFISRYRKEATGSLDEVAVTAIRDRLTQLKELEDRRDAIMRSLEERELLTDELKEKLTKAETLATLEDIYLPFRPKRKTRASVAREKGLEPLAARIFAQDDDALNQNLESEAALFIDEEKGVHSVEEALAGARDIMAEWMNEDMTARANLRSLFSTKAVIKSKAITGVEEEGIKYKDYYAWEEPVAKAPSHRILAMRRGEKEGFLSLSIFVPDDEALVILRKLFIKANHASSTEVELALVDGYHRLLFPSMETEIRLMMKDRADRDAIKVFAENLRQLLLAPPLGEKSVLAIDPGFRTGCKVVCLDRQGKLLQTVTVFPHNSENERKRAAETIVDLCRQYAIEAIAIGNGTAGRETEVFIQALGQTNIPVIMVNESGASIYSASEVAREEFPEHDITVRGAVSIGRRLMDPLAELVKIDPKSIGVGQYQHDVDQTALKKSLDDIVESCVNGVGVEVNTASKELLTYVSGLGPALAKSIVAYRNENGPFSSREALKKVPRLGAKAFEQAAGFLRIRGAANPLDASAVHPESYPVVEAMTRDLGATLRELMMNAEVRKKIDLSRYISDKIGLPTLHDIMAELAKPGRDPREQFEVFRFQEGVEKMEDVQPGMKLPGIVTNITAFGAFVDIGVHQDGLVHISQLSNTFVKNANDIVKVHQKVTVTVLDVDVKRKRISLSMKDTPANKAKT
ncbi:MAG TPA: Tex family protein [Syntrophorhabdaceae bacterium]|nr:Tex family protein [Syntrophorhabdaceae bacterium]